MSSIAALRALLADQKKREVELLKQLVDIKKREVEEPKIDIKLHQLALDEVNDKLDEVNRQLSEEKRQRQQTESDLNKNLEKIKLQNSTLSNDLLWYQNNYQYCSTKFQEFESQIGSLNTTNLEQLNKIKLLESNHKTQENSIVTLNTQLTTLSNQDLENKKIIDNLHLKIKSMELSETDLQEKYKIEITEKDSIIKQQLITLAQTNDMNKSNQSKLQSSTYDIETSKTRIQSLIQEADLLNKKLKEKDAMIVTNTQLIEQYSVQLQQWNIYNQQIMYQKNESDEKMKAMFMQITEYEQQIQQFQINITESKTIINNLTLELTHIKDEVREAKNNENYLTTELSETKSYYEKELLEVNHVLDEKSQKLQIAMTNERDTNRRLIDLQSKHDTLNKQYNELDTIKTSLEIQNKEKTQQIDTITQKVTDITNEYKLQSDIVNKLKQELEQYTTQFHYLTQEYQSYQYQNTDITTQLKSDLLNCQNNLSQWKIKGDDYEKERQLLITEKEEKVTTIEIKTIEINNLYADIAENKDLYAKLKAEYDEFVVTKELLIAQYEQIQDEFTLSKRMLAATKDQHAQKIQSLETKIDDLTTKLTENTDELEERNNQLTTTKQEYEDLQKQYSKIKNDSDKFQLNLKNKLQELSSLQQQYEDKEKECEMYTDNIAELQTEISTKSNLINQLQIDISQCTANIKTKDNLLDNNKKEIQQLKNDIKSKSDENTALEDKLKQAHIKLDKWEVISNEYENQIAILTKYGETVNNEKIMLENTVFQYSTMYQDMNDKYTQCNIQLQDAIIKSETLEKQYHNINQEADTGKKQLIDQISKLEKSNNNKDIELKSLLEEKKKLDILLNNKDNEIKLYNDNKLKLEQSYIDKEKNLIDKNKKEIEYLSQNEKSLQELIRQKTAEVQQISTAKLDLQVGTRYEIRDVD